uniref:Uncharacterized protein n=1 Tax=Aegilops tauschii subsp. strangulata TaxID=200361 RepID=A0A453CKW1_AEGTS
MALQRPAPATPLPTCHHRQNAGVLLQRPSRRRFRPNAQKKPGSASPRTGTPSGSESDNVVLKAAWYGSEALGIAASFFRPPSPEADAGATDDGPSEFQPVGRAQVAEAIKDDFARSYFVTGQELSSTRLYCCTFAVCSRSHCRKPHARGLRRRLRVRRPGGFIQRPATLQEELHQLRVTAGEVQHEANEMGGCRGTFPVSVSRSLQQQSGELFRQFIGSAGCRTNRSGTGVSAASCRSRGGPFSPQPGTRSTTSMPSRGRCAGMSKTGTSPRWRSCGRYSGPADGYVRKRNART